jgi:hypothetical protein
MNGNFVVAISSCVKDTLTVFWSRSNNRGGNGFILWCRVLGLLASGFAGCIQVESEVMDDRKPSSKG